MALGIGNPDWQRRYTTSAVALFAGFFPDNATRASGIQDSNGFEYLVVTVNNVGSTVFSLVGINWFQDEAATLSLGTTNFTIAGGTFYVLKMPVITRYWTMSVVPSGGVAGGTLTGVVYGSNADQENLLTQNTASPLLNVNQFIGAGAVHTTVAPSVYGGGVMITIDDNVNNKWTVWLEYYEALTQTWDQFWSAHGLDKGQGWTERIILPYAPVRINVRNDDTVTHTFIACMLAP